MYVTWFERNSGTKFAFPRARAKALANCLDVAHGVHIKAIGNNELVFFLGSPQVFTFVHAKGA